MIPKNAVWFVTGCSKGLGKAIVLRALEAGFQVVATARRKDDIVREFKDFGESVFPIALDVTSSAQIEAAVAEATGRFQGIDVLVNNAGYGYLAAIEEGEDTDIQKMFQTNVFGPLSLIKAVLPSMRRRGSGHIVNISSVGGFVTFPAVGYYHMAKFALEGMSETLAQEVAPFGIGVTIVEPGAFRTDFRGGSIRQSAIRLPDYAGTAGKARDNVLNAHGKQKGDPARGANAIIEAIQANEPPLHLVLGGDALDQMRKKISSLQKELAKWETVTRGTDFQDEQ